MQRNESIDLNSIHVNPANPHEFAAAGDEEWAYVYDARMIRMQRQALQVTPAATPVGQYCPSHLMSEGSRASAHITACAFSRRGELLLSYSGDGIYLFHPWLKGEDESQASTEDVCPLLLFSGFLSRMITAFHALLRVRNSLLRSAHVLFFLLQPSL